MSALELKNVRLAGKPLTSKLWPHSFARLYGVIAMRLILLIGAQIFFAIVAVDNSFAQGAPTFPRPPTKEACSNYRSETIRYWRELQAIADACQQRLFQQGHYGDNVRIRCSPVGWPRGCAAEIERSLCAQEEGGPLINRCDAEASAIERLKEKATDTAIEKGAKAVGGEEAENKIKALKKTIDEVNDLRNLIKRASDYSKLSDREKLDLNRDLAKKLNAFGNSSELSKNLTGAALGGMTAINKDALSKLDRELQAIGEKHKTLIINRSTALQMKRIYLDGSKRAKKTL